LAEDAGISWANTLPRTKTGWQRKAFDAGKKEGGLRRGILHWRRGPYHGLNGGKGLLEILTSILEASSSLQEISTIFQKKGGISLVLIGTRGGWFKPPQIYCAIHSARGGKKAKLRPSCMRKE